jgi:hypothetical protein
MGAVAFKDMAEASSTDTAPQQAVRRGPYEPSVLDVLVVKAMLNKALRLPPELLYTIVDFAEYWPHSTAVTDFKAMTGAVVGGDDLRVLGGIFNGEDKFLV